MCGIPIKERFERIAEREAQLRDNCMRDARLPWRKSACVHESVKLARMHHRRMLGALACARACTPTAV